MSGTDATSPGQATELLQGSKSSLASSSIQQGQAGDSEKQAPSCVHQKCGKWNPIYFCCSFICICLIIIVITVAVVKISQDHETFILYQEPCPENWIYINRTCYYISVEERGWESSRNFCQSQGASLLLLKSHQDMAFAHKLSCRKEFWIGLQRIREELTWLDGTSYNQSLYNIEDTGECAFINWKQISMSGCKLPQRWICRKESYGAEVKLGIEKRTMAPIG